MKFADQIVLVTGSSRGLGASIVRAFHQEGAKVVINHVSEESSDQAQALAKELGKNAFVVRADVTDPEDVFRLFAISQSIYGGPFTTIVNNFLPKYAFVGDERPKIGDIKWTEFEGQMTTVRGALNTTQALLTSLAAVESKPQPSSIRIINVGSNLVHYPVVPYHDYIAAKAALLGFTRTMAAELGEKGINVNMVSGGLLKLTDASSATPADVWPLTESETALKRVTTPEEVADVCLFLASDWARAVTGQEIIVDGGQVMK